MKPDDSAEAGTFDLFGRPVEPLRERRGRPSYAKTEENQRFVEVRAAAGWSQDAIAADMGIDPDTLRKHFSAELKNAALKVQGMLLDVLQKRAREGHVPSVKQLSDQIKATAAKAPRKKESAPAEKPADAPLGKKAQRLLDAQVKPDDWGDLMANRRDRKN